MLSQEKLLILIVSVNNYQDKYIRDSRYLGNLKYSANDGTKLAEALEYATQEHQNRQIIVHNDFTYPNLPTLAQVKDSLELIQEKADYRTTILFYFSGHGVLTENQQVPILCLADTCAEMSEDKKLRVIPETGLSITHLLTTLIASKAKQQILLLDACHSGATSFKNLNLNNRGNQSNSETSENLTYCVQKIFRQTTSKSKGFYAMLSCDKNQQSWELPSLKHGLFTYYLIKGIRGEAADSKNIIEADSLYKYVYYQVLRHIDRLNQQIQVYNNLRGQLYNSLTRQTPWRIVEAKGEFIIGKIPNPKQKKLERKAIIINGLSAQDKTIRLANILQGKGNFQIEYFPNNIHNWQNLREVIAESLADSELNTIVLYLRGKISVNEEGVNRLFLGNNFSLTRDWLIEQLNFSAISQTVIIIDCLEDENISKWMTTLQVEESSRSQYIIAASDVNDPFAISFIDVLVKVLEESNLGLSAAQLIARLQQQLYQNKILFYPWFSEATGVIEILFPFENQGKKSTFDAGICPYLGLSAFTKEDSFFYCGRESLVEEVVTLLQETTFLAVLGASGSGKSSLVQGGVLAYLEENGLFIRQSKQDLEIINQEITHSQLLIHQPCYTVSFRPGVNPLKALAIACSETREKIEYLEEILLSGVERFVHWLRERSSSVMVLVIDQFEELFTFTPEAEKQQFLDLILGTLEQAGDRLKIIITLRSDFIATALEIDGLASLIKKNNIMITANLTQKEYQAIIVEPARKVGLSIEPGLVEILLQEVQGQSGALPLLEFILEQLWQNRQENCLSLAIYQEKIGGLKQVLENKANEVYHSLTSKEQECSQWIFTSLVHLGEGREDTRRRLLKSELIISEYSQSLIEQTLQKLIAAKLIVVTSAEDIYPYMTAKGGEKDFSSRILFNNIELEAKQLMVEIAHEILIRNWQLLQSWLNQNRQQLRLTRELEQNAKKWQENNYQADFLLRGAALAQAEELLNSQTTNLSPRLESFINAATEVKQETEKAKQRQQQREIEQERKARRMAQSRTILAMVSTLLIACFGFLADYQRKEAIKQTKRLTLRQEANEVMTLLESKEHIQALILAIKATGSSLKDFQTVLPPIESSLHSAIAVVRERNQWQGHQGAIAKVIFSHDGKYIISAGNSGVEIATRKQDNSIKIWDLRGNQIGQAFDGHQNGITSFDLSANGEYIVSSSGQLIMVSDLEGNQVGETFVGHQDDVFAVAFSPDGKYIVSGSRDKTMRLWDLQGNQIGEAFVGHQDDIFAVAFSPDGKYIVSGSRDNTLRLWDLQGNQIGEAFVGHQDYVFAVAFSPDGKYIVSGSRDKTLRLWDLQGNQIGKPFDNPRIGHKDYIHSVAFSPDGKYIISGGSDRLILLWDLKGNQIGEPLVGHQQGVMSVAFSPDGKYIVSGSSDRTIRLWDLQGNPRIQPFYGHQQPTHSVMFTPNSQLIISATHTEISFWDLYGNPIGSLSDFSQDYLTTVDLSKDGKYIVTAGREGKLRLWDLQSGNQISKAFTGHKYRVNSVAFSPDGQYIVSSGEDKTIRLWDLQGNQIGEAFTGHEYGVNSVAFSPDGQYIVSGGEDKTIRLWDLQGNQIGETFTGHEYGVNSVVFSPDGRYLVSGGNDSTIVIWDLQNHQISQSIIEVESAVYTVAFSPDGQHIATGTENNTIYLWDLQGNQIGEPLRGHQNKILSLEFSPDGKYIISGSGDQTVRLWYFGWKAGLEIACKDLRYHLLLTNPSTVQEKEAASICKQYVWFKNNTDE